MTQCSAAIFQGTPPNVQQVFICCCTRNPKGAPGHFTADEKLKAFLYNGDRKVACPHCGAIHEVVQQPPYVDVRHVGS